MRIVVVGPTHPFKGGIAQHTTELAGQLARAGHDVAVISWDSQYPARLYPGELVVPDGAQEVPLAVPVHRQLNWYDPRSWWQAGKRARAADAIVVAHSNPFQVPAYRSLLTSASRGDTVPLRVLIAHNVTPHESSAWQERAVDTFRGVVDVVVVHSESERAAAVNHLPQADVRLVPLAPHGPARAGEHPRSETPQRHTSDDSIRLLAFGFIRPYKGLDLLLEAMESNASISVTIRGECWDADLDARLRAMALRPSLRDRVDYETGYVAGADVTHLFTTHDAAVLPYSEATGSQNTALAQAFGLPVIVSDLPALTRGVTSDVNGLVVPTHDVATWRQALAGVTRADIARWRDAVIAVDSDAAWSAYLDEVLRPIEPNGTSARRQALAAAQTSGSGVRQAHVISDPASRVAKAAAIADVIGRVAQLEGATVLDDGCGSGYIAQELATYVGPLGSVIGVDRVDERQTTQGYDFVLLEDPALPCASASFDLVVSNHVLEHVGHAAEQNEYLREIHRVLKPGGWAYIAIPNKYRLMEAHYGLPLLSWLPQSAADQLVRATGKGEWYDVEPLSRAALMDAITAAGLIPTDVTGDVARRELAKLPAQAASLAGIPDQILQPALVMTPTFIVLARKP